MPRRRLAGVELSYEEAAMSKAMEVQDHSFEALFAAQFRQTRAWRASNTKLSVVCILQPVRYFRLSKNVTTCPRSAAENRLKLKSSAGCVITVFCEFVAITRQAAL